MCHARALDYEWSLLILGHGYKSKQNGSKCATYTYITGLFKCTYRKIENNYTKIYLNDIKI